MNGDNKEAAMADGSLAQAFKDRNAEARALSVNCAPETVAQD